MTRPMGCRTWDGERMRYLTTLLTTPHSIGLHEADSYYVDISSDEHDKNTQVMWSTGHQALDSEGSREVYDGDYLRFPGQKEVYEVKWDQPEGAWTIAYKGMTAFKIGMVWFMEIAGNKLEGITTKEPKDAV